MASATDILLDPVLFQVGFLNQIPHSKQEEILSSKAKHKTICCGRRAGKSQLIAGELIRGCMSGEYIKQGVITPTYRQSRTVYNKILELLYSNKLYEENIKKSSLSPYPIIVFENGAEIWFMSTDNPTSLRSEAYDRLFIDEAAFIKDTAWNAIRPLTFDTGAPIWQTSTPWGKNKFYNDWLRGMKKESGKYESFQFSTFDNPYIDKETVMDEVEEYGQDDPYIRAEVYGEFIEDQDMFFKTDMIMACIDEDYEYIVNPESWTPNPKSIITMGVDFARMGEDSNVIVILEKPFDNDEVYVKYIEEINKVTLDKMVGKILLLDKKFQCNKIYLDSTGLGSGPTDMINTVSSLRGKVVEVNFGGSIDKKPAKEVLYNNLKRMMILSLNEIKGGLHFIKHKKLISQLMELRYELLVSGKVKIHHPPRGHDDYTDALALAALYFRKIQTKNKRFATIA